MKKYFIVAVFWLCSMGYAFGFDSTTVVRPEITKATANSTPLGSIMIWSSHSSPSDEWLECNGQSLVGYPALVALLGKTRAPDFRGIFLRGYGSQSHAQNNGSSVGVTATDYSSGLLGEIQGDATRNVVGQVGPTNTRSGDGESGPFYSAGGWNYHTDTGSSGRKMFNMARVVPTANEIRPVNIAVRYFIKAKE